MDIKKLLIIVTARGGSKGLPGKNLMNVGGKPLLQWTMDAIIAAGLSECTCILSTDDEKIASIGKEIGYRVPFIRPQQLATDDATSADACLHALQWLGSHEHFTPEALMLLQPTSPFRPPQALMDACNMLNDKAIEAVIGVQTIYRTLHTIFHATQDMQLIPCKPTQDKVITRRQDIQPLCTPNGTLYLIRYETFITTMNFYPAKLRGIVMNQIESLDLDDQLDWQLLEAVYKARLTWCHKK